MNKFIKGLIRASVILVAAFLIAVPMVGVVDVSAADGDDYFWVGGTGNWSDFANHWATTSGGGTFHGAAPNSTNDVFFDANSFSGAGQVVTVDAAAVFCKGMSWAGASFAPTLAFGANTINYLTDVVFESGMTTTATTGRIAYGGSSPATITTNGVALACRVINATGTGKVTLLDNLTITNASTPIAWLAGELDTNGKTVTLSGGLSMSGAVAKTLTLGASTINCTNWDLSGTNITLTANTATINCSGNFTSTAGIATYNVVNLTGATSTITGSNTFNTLGLTRAGVQTITFTDTSTQIVTMLSRDIGSSVKTLQGSGVAGWAITVAGGGTIYNDYLSISRSTSSPAGGLIAGVHSTNGGNNTDWIFVAAIATNDETNLNAHETTLNGTITTNGTNATRRGFQYGLTSGALDLDWHQDGSYGTGAYSVQLTGIASDTTYYYRAYAVTGGITEYGAEGSFTTRDTAWILLRFILPIVVAFGLILGAIGAWGGSGKMTIIGVAIGLAGFVMIQAIIGTL